MKIQNVDKKANDLMEYRNKNDHDVDPSSEY